MENSSYFSDKASLVSLQNLFLTIDITFCVRKVGKKKLLKDTKKSADPCLALVTHILA